MIPLIRRGRPGEELAVSRLLAETWHDTHDAELGVEAVSAVTAKWHAPALLRAQIEDPSRCFLVAEDGKGALVGHALSWLGEDGCLNLLRLYVLPRAQGQGLGSRLFDTAMAAWPDARRFRLEVRPDNRRAICFYESRGFRIVRANGAEAGFTDVPALVMERSRP
jgi:ribosomal protein S18 acetylase RimI-like enzyme